MWMRLSAGNCRKLGALRSNAQAGLTSGEQGSVAYGPPKPGEEK